MATDYTKEVARAIDRLTAEVRKTNSRLAKVEEALIAKQFDDWVAPPIGTAYQNSKGCVMMSKFDYERMEKKANAREDSSDSSTNDLGRL